MSEVEGVGEMVTGAALAAAIEPAAAVKPSAAMGVPQLFDPWCPYCAAASESAVHRSLRTFFGDLVQGLFNSRARSGGRCRCGMAAREMTRAMSRASGRGSCRRWRYICSRCCMFAVLNSPGPWIRSGGGAVNSPVGGAAELNIGKCTDTATARQADVAAIDADAQKKEARAAREVERGELVTFEADEQTMRRNGCGTRSARSGQPRGVHRQVQDAASKYSWLLIPLSVRSSGCCSVQPPLSPVRSHGVRDLSLSFMMMLVIAAGLLVSAGLTSVASFLFFIPPIHMYRQLRGAYQLGWISALVRTLLLVSFSFVVSMLFLLTIFAVGIL